jgi:ABC-2 type transport system permease protein
MRGAWVTFRKELLSYCVSPVSWLIAVLFYVLRGYETIFEAARFAAYQSDQDQFPTACYRQVSTYFMVILVPGILTMKCFAEERRSGSLETLMTAPTTDGGVTLGKWAAAVAFYGLLWLPTVVELWLLQADVFLGADLAFGPVFCAYLGMFLISSMLMAFGCLASSLTENVLLAALLGVLFNLVLLVAPTLLRGWLGPTAENYYVAELLSKLDVMSSFNDWFARGLIDTSQVAFFVGGIAFFLFLTTVSLSARRVA